MHASCVLIDSAVIVVHVSCDGRRNGVKCVLVIFILREFASSHVNKYGAKNEE